MIIRIDNTLDDAECGLLCDAYDEHHHHTTNTDWCGRPIVGYPLLHEPQAEIIQKILARSLVEIETRLGIHNQLLEQLFLTKTGIGVGHMRHADNCKLQDGQWVPNHTPQRSFAVMQYLNGDFEGGEIHWPDRGVTMKPKAGMMVAFPAGREYVHEVLPVNSGVRYTVALWMTENHEYEMKLLG